MYKRKMNQVSVFDDPAMFGGIALNPENDWVKLAKLIPWWAFEEKICRAVSIEHRAAGGEFANGAWLIDHQGKL